MAFKYDRFFNLLKQRGITTYKIRKENLMSQASLTKMRNGEGNIDTRTLERLCALLFCQPCDIMEYVDDESGERTPSWCIDFYSLLSDTERERLFAQLADGQTVEDFIKSAVLEKIEN